jgi:hypothetical protein
VSKKYVIGLWLALALVLQACGSKQETPNGELILTQAMQTAEAKLTERANEIPTQTVTPTPEPTPTVTGTATQTPSKAVVATSEGAVISTGCDVAGFVADVTIPDGTQFSPGADFVKTWRLSNAGTCTWTSAYTVVYYSGEVMSAEKSIQLTTDSVAPGESIDISLDMVAPSTTGSYYSYWALKNAAGTTFGIGSAGSPFYVQINVSGTPVAKSATPTVTGSAVATTAAPTATQTQAANTATSTLEPTVTETVAPYP